MSFPQGYGNPQYNSQSDQLKNDILSQPPQAAALQANSYKNNTEVHAPNWDYFYRNASLDPPLHVPHVAPQNLQKSQGLPYSDTQSIYPIDSAYDTQSSKRREELLNTTQFSRLQESHQPSAVTGNLAPFDDSNNGWAFTGNTLDGLSNIGRGFSPSSQAVNYDSGAMSEAIFPLTPMQYAYPVDSQNTPLGSSTTCLPKSISARTKKRPHSYEAADSNDNDDDENGQEEIEDSGRRGGGDGAVDRRKGPCHTFSISQCVDLNEYQKGFIETVRGECEKLNCIPTEKQIKHLSGLAALPEHKVAMILGETLRLTKCPLQVSHTSQPDAKDEDISLQVEAFLQKADRESCSKSRGKKFTGGTYICTRNGCHFSTSHRDSWERHELLRQPQELWLCIRCRADSKSYIVVRKEKMLTHAERVHGITDKEQQRTLRKQSILKFDATFDSICRWRHGHRTTQCSFRANTWSMRVEHYIAHFDGNISRGPWKLPGKYPPEQRTSGSENSDDNDDHSDHNSSESDFDRPPSKRARTGRRAFQKRGPTSKAPTGTPKRNRGRRGQTSITGTNMDVAHTGIMHLKKPCSIDLSNPTKVPVIKTENNVHPAGKIIESERANERSLDTSCKFWTDFLALPRHECITLVYVRDQCAVEAHMSCRYLAVSYAWGDDVSSRALRSKEDLAPAHQIPTSVHWNITMKCASELGLEYVWFENLGGLSDGCSPERALQGAALILVLGSSQSEPGKTWRFSCHYSSLKTVRSWARDSVSFQHLQWLGQGTSSTVDKVRLLAYRNDGDFQVTNVDNSTFARKIYIGSSAPTRLSAMQEIEVMKRLRQVEHPHLARFIAAYCDHSATNIIMSPVAECNLQQCLVDNDVLSRKVQFFSTWYMSLASAVAYMHSLNCRHKDIKPANILISDQNILLSDFGSSRAFSETDSRSDGDGFLTPRYCAPEVARHARRGRSADIFSLGCVFVEMISVELGMTITQLNEAMTFTNQNGRIEQTYHRNLPALSRWLAYLMPHSKTQKMVTSIARRMLSPDPGCRPSAVEVIQSLCNDAHCHGRIDVARCHCCPCPSNDLTTEMIVRPSDSPISSLFCFSKTFSHAWASQASIPEVCLRAMCPKLNRRSPEASWRLFKMFTRLIAPGLYLQAENRAKLLRQREVQMRSRWVLLIAVTLFKRLSTQQKRVLSRNLRQGPFGLVEGTSYPMAETFENACGKMKSLSLCRGFSEEKDRQRADELLTLYQNMGGVLVRGEADRFAMDMDFDMDLPD